MLASFGIMNKVLCILLLLGAISAFVLSQRDSYKWQNHSYYGWPVGEEQTAHIQTTDRFFYIVIGATFMSGFLYFLAKQKRGPADLKYRRRKFLGFVFRRSSFAKSV